MGLPGSGKSSFANDVKNGSFAKMTHIIHVDEIRDKYFCRNVYTLRDYIIKGMESWRGQDSVLIDALILTNQDLFNVITCLIPYTSRGFGVIIHRWNEDRQTCLKNDGGRRESSSTGTILNARYEEVDVEALNERLKKYGADGTEVTKVINHEVVLKPDWIRYFETYVDFNKDGKFRSEKWSLGGIYGSCYGGTSHSDGEEPAEFAALDKLLDKKCPNLLYRHYRYIWKECVSTEETTEDEYYGGYTNYMNWACDLQKMYNMLKDFGYDVTPNE